MRSSTVIAFFAGSAAAQSTAVVLNPLMPASTLTVIGSSSGTTTYVNSCSDGGIPASYLTPGTLVTTPISAPSTTAAARLRRQEDGLFGGFCEPITIKQGSSSVEIHLEDPTKGAWTADMNCAWKGELTSADLTCTATQSGSFAKLNDAEGITSDVLKASEVAEASAIQTVSVVQSASNSASATASGSQSGSANATASGSGAPVATGAAAGAPLSKGVMAFVGGVAALAG
ncbi:hypothetical protein BU25DRAFT_433562 [Macroventuria anomochaeta]|uniref:Uncharacterized protein n=1 Tax=Macroventuria anomochaeta TaxID=301207 RepID=A0ACB6RQZ2_9PLEO|nr:uncharacterized protein BU25DRAFT_433562 [Macroventuria anomochaeta]KAF2624326.1 hypothetical protein BU25DRAFT_433562 [Macroventuria anomochaeta]